MDFDFEISGELKNYLQARVFGDMHVDVRIEFKPMWMPKDVKEKMALEQVNQRLRYISGEIAHEVRETLQKHLATPTNQDKEEE